MKSIIQDIKECWFCGSRFNLHKHHIFMGSRRKASEKYGCHCYLCAYHHNMSDNSVHNNRSMDMQLKRVAQHRFEDEHGHEKFMQVFGKNYL